MILEGILTIVVLLFGFALGLKLFNKYKFKQLCKKFPEGTETKSKPVTRLNDIKPSAEVENCISKIAKQEDPVSPNKVMDKLLK